MIQTPQASTSPLNLQWDQTQLCTRHWHPRGFYFRVQSRAENQLNPSKNALTVCPPNTKILQLRAITIFCLFYPCGKKRKNTYNKKSTETLRLFDLISRYTLSFPKRRVIDRPNVLTLLMGGPHSQEQTCTDCQWLQQAGVGIHRGQRREAGRLVSPWVTETKDKPERGKKRINKGKL